MDPVSIIVGALVNAVANLAEPAVKDAYEGLKAIIKKKFEGNKTVSNELTRFENDPEAREERLTEVLSDVEAGKDEEILVQTEKLKTALQNIGVQISSNTMIGGANSTNIQQNIGKMSGGTVIGSQTNYGDKKPDK